MWNLFIFLFIISFYYGFIIDITRKKEKKSCLTTTLVFTLCSALSEGRDWETQHFTIKCQDFWFTLLFVKRYDFTIFPIAAAVKWVTRYSINHFLSIDLYTTSGREKWPINLSDRFWELALRFHIIRQAA